MKDKKKKTKISNDLDYPGRTKAAKDVVLLQLTVLAIFLTPRGLKGMRKHCRIEHFFRFVKQIWPKPSVVVTLQRKRRPRRSGWRRRRRRMRWSLSVGISKSSGIFFKPQKSIILKGFSGGIEIGLSRLTAPRVSNK